MKQLLLLLVMALAATTGNAQLGKYINKAKAKVEQRVDNKVDQAMDKALDSTRISATKEQAVSSNKPGKDAMAKAYASYDFIPGEKILYANNLPEENSGELPTGWNSNSTATIVTVEGLQGNWLKIYQGAMCLTENEQAFDENYTVEFDLVLQHAYNGWLLPYFSFGMLASGDLSTTDNRLFQDYKKTFSMECKLQPGVNNDSRVVLETDAANQLYLKTDNKKFAALQAYYGNPMHVAIQVQQQRIRVWINEHKLFDLPKAIPAGTACNQLWFKTSTSPYSDEQVAFYISRLKVATGIADTRHRLLEEGSFSTTGILFDVNAANIRPESNGVLASIAEVLQKNPSVRLQIIGHTDSDGDKAGNLVLSEKRARAVKEALVNHFSIDAARLETAGQGDEQPVADNNTKAGKAQNRRVEFLKL